MSPSPQTFFPGELGLLEQQDPDPVTGKVICGRRASWARAHHDHVGLFGLNVRHGHTSSHVLVKNFTSMCESSVGPLRIFVCLRPP